MFKRCCAIAILILAILSSLFADDVKFMVGGQDYEVVVGFGPVGVDPRQFSRGTVFQTPAPVILRSPVEGVVLVSTLTKARPPRYLGRLQPIPKCDGFWIHPDCLRRSRALWPETDGFSLIAIRVSEGEVLLIYNLNGTELHVGDRVNRGDAIGSLAATGTGGEGYFQLGLLKGNRALAARDLQFLLWSENPDDVPGRPPSQAGHHNPGTLLSFESR